MKILKFILTLLISVSITSCSSDESTPPFDLTSSNFAGSYDINSITYKEVETITSSSGNSSIVLTTINGVADSFDDISFVINANGTFTASGKYRNVITEKPNTGSTITDNEIIVFNASGTYQLNTIDNTITFNQQSGDFIDGVFSIKSFKETGVTIEQEIIETDGNSTLTFNGSIGLIRK
ncbi:MAG: hypothetical protein ABJH82_11260 [Polaribacter sp.]|uniref:hypothetical protein n=1 Tax=Polaribacter sp. TaxID=1920175 RepID=UPI003266FF0D